MLKGIGADILRKSELLESSLQVTDPFFRKTYAPEETKQARDRQDPLSYYATRFSGKEAVFKCLGINPEDVRLNEIVILDDENGRPHVRLTGRLLQAEKKQGIREILVSLSDEREYVVAFAAAQTEKSN